jgi:tetratricopeptide (TPR) repeat protein
MIRTKTLILVPLVLALSGLAAWAQTKGRLGGRISGPDGSPIEKAEVTIVSQKTTSVQYEIKTDKNGHFIQIGITPGYYRVSVKKAGFAPASREARVRIDEETTCDLTLKPIEESAQKALSGADQIFLKGNKLYAEQKYGEAAASYGEAIGLNPANWAYHFNLGLALKKAGKSEEALAAFRKAVELNPDSYSANKETGESLAKAGQFADAKTYYEKAAALSPDDPDAQYNLGVCLVNLGETEAALPLFQKTVELKPDYADAFYQMATILISQNKVPEAKDALEKFLALAPDHEKAPLARQLLDYLKK